MQLDFQSESPQTLTAKQNDCLLTNKDLDLSGLL